MPPPPPPSKSYLLVLDTDSEDEEEEHYQYREPPQQQRTQIQTRLQQQRLQQEENQQQLQQQEQQLQQKVLSSEATQEEEKTANPSTTLPSSRSRRLHVVECDETDDEVSSDSVKPLTKNQKKKKKQRQKKKKRMENNDSTMNNRVAFSDVSVQTYARCFGVDAVPGDGGWPLGMEMEPLRTTDSADMEEVDVFRISVDEYETLKQERLQARWEALKTKCKEEVVATMTQRRANDSDAYETRQWDYKRGVKNPLFRILHEDERRELLLCSSEESSDSPLEGNDDSEAFSVNSSSGGPSSAVGRRRTRSSSVSSPSEANNDTSPGKRQTRSSSVSSSCEAFNDTYDQVYVHHVRNELEKIRNERTKEGSIGCSCRKLTVYIPPKDGSGGKKAQHRRMKPQRLAQELKKRGLYNSRASREEMELVLHKAVEDEPCCSADCPCHRNGVGCQSDACSCWHDSHVFERKSNNNIKSSHGPVPVDEIQRRCGNPIGMYAVDLDAIDKTRAQTLAKLNLPYCQPCSS